MKDEAMQRYEYHVWANGKVFGHLQELPGELWETRVNSVFPTVADAVAHMYRTDYVWFRSMAGDSFDQVVSNMGRIQEESAGKSAEELERLYRDMSDRFRAFLTERDLRAVRAYHHPQYGTLNASYSELVTHVVNHGTYHRGNITAMLRQQGHPGPSTDYVYYLYSLNK